MVMEELKRLQTQENGKTFKRTVIYEYQKQNPTPHELGSWKPNGVHPKSASTNKFGKVSGAICYDYS